MDRQQRDKLILKYTPLVKNVVGRMTARLPLNAADREDLIHVGIIGLITAIERFDEKRNVQFETFARFRIRGAVLDELRERDWLPRSTRGKDSRLEKVYATLQRQFGRPPEDEEIADAMGLSLDGYYKLLDEVRGVSLISSEDLPKDYFDRHGVSDVLERIDQGHPLNLLASEERRQTLKAAVDALPKKEKLVLSLYYYEELTMKEIGKTMDLTESRVCQIHSQAVLRLRSLVKELA